MPFAGEPGAPLIFLLPALAFAQIFAARRLDLF
jgi:hypothetical protein